MDATHRAVELAARDSYGRLVAYLAARSRDVAAAEDALGDAFRVALETWPRTGVPDRPEAWLLTAARRRLIDQVRHARVQNEAIPELERPELERAQQVAETDMFFPDERLKLMFVCAHPAIDPNIRTPLMLQTVLGLDAARIASKFLVSPSTMGQRLSRAKAKIRDAGIAFEIPEPHQLPARLDSVLEAIYATQDAELGRLMLTLMPDQQEVRGLLSLMLHNEARRDARRVNGAYVPLSEQDVALWSRPLIDEAEQLLANAARFGVAGRFQLEAAIQSVHAQRAVTGRTDWESIALLYEALVRMAPTTGALIARAAAIGEAHGPEAGWAALKQIQTENYQPYWAVAAHLLKRMRRFEEAKEAYDRAIGLCDDAAMRNFLILQASPERLLC